MATQEKLQKSLETLKNLSNSSNASEQTRKKEIIHHCHNVTEAFSNPTIKVSTNIQVLLSVTIDTLLKLCDDSESDIRMLAGECLNRIILAVSDGHIRKVQIELHEQIKKNSSARSLRAALVRFAQLAHHIKPQKGKAYVKNLFPSIIKISECSEESIHETLASCLPKIMKVLGCFAQDGDIKLILKAFLKNICSTSPVIRRSASNCILNTCIYSRTPYVLLTYCINIILDMVLPVNDNQDNYAILGTLYCLRTLLPSLKDSNPINDGFSYSKDIEIIPPLALNKFLQIYELCLYYLNNSDHNIVNASLEALNSLLSNITDELKSKLISSSGIDKCRIHKSQSFNNIRSPSQLSIATNVTSEDNLFAECELTETIHADIEKWIGESKLSVMTMSQINVSEKANVLDSHPGPNLNFQDYANVSSQPERYDLELKSKSIGDNLDKYSENSSEESVTASESVDKLLYPEVDIQEIDIGNYLDKCPSLLYCTRLITKSFLLNGLPGNYISDKLVRVSVKSLALACLSSIFRIYPQGFFKYLDKNFSDANRGQSCRISSQGICDIMLFADHSDPQLRGAVRGIVSNLVYSVLTESNLDFDGWMLNLLSTEGNVCKNGKYYRIEDFISILYKGLQDENSNCLKHTLLSVNMIINLLLESRSCYKVSPLLNVLPLVGNNPYWLVKVTLCELVSKLSYVTIFYITGDNIFQSKIIHNILLEFLKDSDQRIRTAAANALAEIIPNLYFEEYHPKESLTTTKALSSDFKFSYDESETNLYKENFIESMPFPYSKIGTDISKQVDCSLSKIIMKLYCNILSSNYKYFIYGCIEALSILSTYYPCTIYRKSWCDYKNYKYSEVDVSMTYSTEDLFTLCVNLLSNSVHIYDIPFITNLMNLAANLYAGHATLLLKPVDLSDTSHQTWSMIPSSSIKPLSDEYLLHTVKLLNIFHCAINDIVPVVPQSKTVLPHLPSTGTLSPIKRRRSEDKKSPAVPGRIVIERDEKIDKKEHIKAVHVGYFAGSQHYMKLFEVLRSAFVNYKTSLDPKDSGNFLELLRKTLRTLSVMLEVATLNEFGRISEEILSYLLSTFNLETTITVQCVQQLLKCLFGSNLTSSVTDILNENKKQNENENYSFYYNIFQKPSEEMSVCVNSLKNINKIECDGDSTVMGYLHRRDVKKPITFTRASDKTLANYIRIFEPMVIKSLKEYTETTNVKLQCAVLQLISQLVQLGVNYCLLDSEQVFKGVVLKQVEYIEAGQVQHSEELTAKIFQFLVHLSYSKQHSKSIINIPKIIQLCDGLMASGQDPKTHCIPALKPIVQDVFLIRNRTNTIDMEELETTREVILSMLLRLLEYKEVIDLVSLVLDDSKYCTDDAEKWFRWSGQVMVVFLQLLKQNKIKIDSKDVFVSLKKFIFAINPNVFKPANELVIMLFQTPPSTENKTMLNRWISRIILLLLLLSPLKEDDLHSIIRNSKAKFSPASVFENITTIADPLNVKNDAESFENISEEDIIARMIFRAITIISKEVLEALKNATNHFLVSQFNEFLMYCSHMLQSGSLCRVSQASDSILSKKNATDINVELLNERFALIGRWHPTLAFQWSHVLSVLNYNDLTFWKTIINTSLSTPINETIINIGSTIVFCDYLNENISETKQLSWNLSENSDNLVNLIDEIPVSEFVTFIHRNATLSRVLIQSIAQKSPGNQKPLFKIKILKCLENSHDSQTGAVIKLLIPQMLNNRQIAISRLVANLASRKIEYLFTLSIEQVHSQLSKEDLFKIKEGLNAMHLAKKYETLISLLDKLLVQYYDMSPFQFNRDRMVNTEHIKKLQVNKKWFLSQIQKQYSDGRLRKENAKVMEKLEYNELTTFMSSRDFDKVILRDCIEAGIRILRDEQLKEEPPILKASVNCILKDISVIIDGSCNNHEVFKIVEPHSSYAKQILESFNEDNFAALLFDLNASLTILMRSLSDLPTLQLSDIDAENIAKFAVLSLEYLRFVISKDESALNINCLDVIITSSNEILKQSQFSNYLGLDNNISWLCSAIDVLYYIVTYLLRHEEPLPSIETNLVRSDTENSETKEARDACHSIYTLIQWLYKTQSSDINIPRFLFEPLRSLVVSLSRLPLVNSYNLVPSRVWKLGWEPTMTGRFSTQVPAIPIDMLQEIDVFEEYLFRVNLLGWTTRQQFEETWMSFLSVLWTPLDSVDSVDMSNTLHASSLAIKAITVLLLQTMSYPVLGNKNVSEILHVSRNSRIPDTTISIRKLKLVQNHIEHKFKELSSRCGAIEIRNVFSNKNFEKVNSQYSYGQVSIKYFLTATNPEEQTNSNNSHAYDVYKKRKKLLDESGLDINSCLQFLLDYYTQLMRTESTVTDLRILHETVRSTLFISDLFTDKAQFSWMLEMFMELAKTHVVEDELIHQYLIVGICKAVAVLTPEIEIFEQTKKLLVQFLKSPFLSARISCLYGILYILEGCILSNTTIGGISEELQLILPCAVEYVQQHLNASNVVLKKCQEHTMLVWSLTFYLIENIEEVHMEANFVVNTMNSALTAIQNKSVGNRVQTEIIKSLERLLLIKPDKFGKNIQKLALEKMRDENPSITILGIQLLITYMYVDCWEHLEKLEPDSEQSSPDHLVQTIEKLSAIFERIKKSYALEVEVLCSILPMILKDFFSPSDILTKVIGEFLSPQQPYLKLMSGVVFQVRNKI
ncbi:huntingtin isoform X2 [Sitophilus oryzae]|uniref:Huntingtin isoform X2 n=1 Tax=Sitophilus oryzae TaxID=7048 RepID=A0A6J2XGC9_SITOR|nr:huntingtin isoform X2 [Sitophilus oryzae]